MDLARKRKRAGAIAFQENVEDWSNATIISQDFAEDNDKINKNQNFNIIEDAIITIQHFENLHSLNNIEEIMPDFVIMMEPDITIVRLLEVT